MRDPAVAPDLRIKVAQAAAPFCHPKPTTGVPTDPGAGAMMVIEGVSAEDRARIDARLDRFGELDLKNLLGDRLSPMEQSELERHRAWYQTLPPHLLGLDEDDIELRRLMAEGRVTVERPGPHDDEDD